MSEAPINQALHPPSPPPPPPPPISIPQGRGEVERRRTFALHLGPIRRSSRGAAFELPLTGPVSKGGELELVLRLNRDGGEVVGETAEELKDLRVVEVKGQALGLVAHNVLDRPRGDELGFEDTSHVGR